ncbi:hypothetical protein [Streptomyces tauricus]|uniref:hypothetical protein n=1 Tax=Streptomyces tauricus TaxID=68274 RepID=UPI0033B1D90D
MKPYDPPADPVAEFVQVAQGVLAVADQTYGVEELEQGLERALAILQSNPKSKKGFEDEIISLIDSPVEGVVELVSFLMHELRWPGVQEAIKDRVLYPKGDVSNIRLYEAMLDSFSDAWRDRDLYTRFA